jgi:transcriptional regulator NrdR family protein
MAHIVKRFGHNEPYDGRKLYASIFAACLSVKEPPATAELVAQEVQTQTEKWLTGKHEVTSNDIRREAAKHLQVVNPDAGFQYLHHRIVG